MCVCGGGGQGNTFGGAGVAEIPELQRLLKFICRDVALRVEKSVCWWHDLPEGAVVHIPINHNEGNYTVDMGTLMRMVCYGQVVLRNCEPDGSQAPEGSAPNGAFDDISGVCNERGIVFGLMPHPERMVDPEASGTDGQSFFQAIVERLASV